MHLMNERIQHRETALAEERKDFSRHLLPGSEPLFAA
jgi:hypothetical protein